MKITQRTALGAAALAAIGLAAPTFASGTSHLTKGSGQATCGNGNVTWDPTSVFPPNHRMQTVNVTYQADKQSTQYDKSRVTIGVITDDQMLPDGSELNGSGNTDFDSSGTGNKADAAYGQPATTTAQIRAERSGRVQEGRTYDIQVTCTDYNSTVNAAASMTPAADPTESSQTIDITVNVPHDQGNNG